MLLEKTISNVIQSTKKGSELSGRMPFSVSKGIVTDNIDPENLRRIKATTALMPGINTYWLSRLYDTGVDGLVPKIGATILIIFEESDPVKGFYIPINTEVNKPLSKNDPINDHFSVIPGIINSLIGDDTLIRIENNTITINTSNIVINSDINITGDIIINGSVTLNSNSVSINGNQVATVGALDSRGDTLVNKGW